MTIANNQNTAQPSVAPNFGGGDVFQYLLLVYRYTKKPCYLSQVTLLANGSLVHTYTRQDKQVVGYPFINKLLLYRSGDCDVVEALSIPLSQQPNESNERYFSRLERRTRRYRQAQIKAIENENRAALENDRDYWIRDESDVQLRDGFIRDTNLVRAYAEYHFNLNISKVLTNASFLLEDTKINNDHLYAAITWSGVVEPIVYGLLDFAGFMPVIGEFADGAGVFYAAIIRQDMDRAAGYTLAVVTGVGAYFYLRGGKGAHAAVAEFGEHGVHYSVRSLDDKLDELLEEHRFSILAHDRNIAARHLELDLPYHHLSKDELYNASYANLLPAVNQNLPKAKAIIDDVANFCPLVLHNPGLLTPGLASVLNAIPTKELRQQFLNHLNDLATEHKILKFVEDLEEDLFREFVQVEVGAVRAWEALFDFPLNRVKVVMLTRRIAFDDFPIIWNKKNPYPPHEELFDFNSGGYIVSHSGHNNNLHELITAKAFMKQGNEVRLLDESLPGKTPDAEIKGVIYDFKNINSSALNITNNIRNKLEDAANQGVNGIVIRIADNAIASSNNGLKMIKQAIQDHANSGKPIPSIIKVLDKDDLTILTYPNF